MILGLTILISVSGIWRVKEITSTVIRTINTDFKMSEHASRVRAHTLQLRRYEKDMLINFENLEKVKAYKDKWDKERTSLLARIADMQEAITNPKQKERMDQIKTNLTIYESNITDLYDLLLSRRVLSVREGNDFVNKVKDNIHEVENIAEDMAMDASAKMVSLGKEILADSGKTTVIMTMIITLVITIFLGIGISIVMIRSITVPVNRVVAGLSEASDQVASASSQVSAASQSLAEGSSEQASALEETSASIEELSSMTTQNAENANHANAVMAETGRVVNEANRSMQELTGAMKEITTSSEDMAKIIKTIDEIAFQTNLLSLNAAVEAARAGEAGAGFAVVADEVRNLAMRSAESAKNTANMIDESIKRIKNGSVIVSKTNEAFEQVLSGSKKVGELVGEIAAASKEQAQGISQISNAIAEMDKVVQQNAANAEESAAASEELNAQAMQMKQFVGELITVVQGSNAARVSSAQTETAPRRRPVLQARTPLAKMPALPGKSGKPVKTGAKIVDPEQVIPMDDDAFKDF
jgi:methyl-accepting chemotaxis protein